MPSGLHEGTTIAAEYDLLPGATVRIRPGAAIDAQERADDFARRMDWPLMAAPLRLDPMGTFRVVDAGRSGRVGLDWPGTGLAWSVDPDDVVAVVDPMTGPVVLWWDDGMDPGACVVPHGHLPDGSTSDGLDCHGAVDPEPGRALPVPSGARRIEPDDGSRLFIVGDGRILCGRHLRRARSRPGQAGVVEITGADRGAFFRIMSRTPDCGACHPL